jgi:hypothetical protein
MPNTIATGLPEPGQPFSWATHANGMMFTAHGPVDATDAIVPGDITEQARLTFSSLAAAVAAAGARMQDVVQVLLYMADAGPTWASSTRSTGSSSLRRIRTEPVWQSRDLLIPICGSKWSPTWLFRRTGTATVTRLIRAKPGLTRSSTGR